MRGNDKMKHKILSAACLALTLSGGVALADISGGPVYSGGGSQTRVRCIVFNAGPGNANIASNVITTGGNPVVLTDDSCGPTLAAGKACVISYAPAQQVAHSCKINANGGVLRGTVVVYGSTDRVLHSADLR